MAHGHGHSDHGHVVTVLPPDRAKIRKIWVTAGILAFFTAIEFICAFLMDKGAFLTSIFVALTFVKTYYIVGEFMHLKYEVKILIWSIVLPMIFIVWLITSQLTEGNAIHELRTWWTTIGGK